MKKINLILTVIIIGLLISSCAKNENTDELNSNVTNNQIASFEDYYNFLQEETTGSILIQSYTSINSTSVLFDLSSNIEGNNQPLGLQVDGNKYEFFEYSFSEVTNRSSANISNLDLENFYGCTFYLEYQSETINVIRDINDGTVIDSLYIPELIEVSFDNLEDGTIGQGTKVNWNTDNLNTKGVVIGFEYIPTSQFDSEIAEKYPNHLMRGVTTADNGEYVFTSNDFDDLPDNAWISFYVGRTGYSISVQDFGDYSLAGLTVSTAHFQISK
jgi:hypothetical protein